MHTIRTTLNLPTELIKLAQKIFGVKTKTEAIVLALEDVLRRQKQMQLIQELSGCAIGPTQAQLRKMRKPRFSLKSAK